MSDLRRTSANKSNHSGISRIFMRSVKELGHFKRSNPVTADSNILKSSQLFGNVKDDKLPEKYINNNRCINLNEEKTEKTKTDWTEEGRKTAVKTARKFSIGFKQHTTDSHFKISENHSNSRFEHLNGKCYAHHSSVKQDSGDIQKPENDEVFVEKIDKDWSVEIVDNYKDNISGLSAHTEKDTIQDSGCVTDLTINKSSLKLFGSSSSYGSVENSETGSCKISDTDVKVPDKQGSVVNIADNLLNFKNSETELVGLWKESTCFNNVEDNLLNCVENGKKLLTDFSDVKKECNDVYPACIGELFANKDLIDSVAGNRKINEDIEHNSNHNLPFHSTPKKCQLESLSVILEEKREVDMSDSRYSGFKDPNNSKRCFSKTQNDNDFRVSGRPKHSQSHYENYVPPRFRSDGSGLVENSEHFASNNGKKEKFLPNHKSNNYRTTPSNYSRVSWHTTGYPSSRHYSQRVSRGRKEQYGNTAPISLMGLQVETPKKYKMKRTEKHFVGNKCNEMNLEVHVSEDWSPEIQETETKDDNKFLGKEENPHSSSNLEQYIPPLPPVDEIGMIDPFELEQPHDVKNVKTPYLPPVPMEILQESECFSEFKEQNNILEAYTSNVMEALNISDTESLSYNCEDRKCSDYEMPSKRQEFVEKETLEGIDKLAPLEQKLIEKESEELYPNQSMPLKSDNMGLRTDYPVSAHEDSSSASSIILRVDDACAYSIFGSTSEADVSDSCLDDSKILENVVSQSSDGEINQFVKDFENDINPENSKNSSDYPSCPLYPGSHEQYKRYWNTTYSAGDVYQHSDYSPLDYEPYGHWYQNIWYEQMIYYWKMYHQQFSDFSLSHEYDEYSQYNVDELHLNNKPLRQRKSSKEGNMTHKKADNVYVSGMSKHNRDSLESRKGAESAKRPSTDMGTEDGNRYSSTGSETIEKDISCGSQSNSTQKMSKCGSNRMERLAQRQHSDTGHYQCDYLRSEEKADKDLEGDSKNHSNVCQYSNRQNNAAGGVLMESSSPSSTKPETDVKKAKPSSDDRKESWSLGEVIAGSKMKSGSSDCCCKPMDVQFIVWRNCKCPAGNPPKVHQILPCNYDDRILDTGCQSYESLEQDEHVGKMTRNIKAPGFLIQPLNSSERDKKYNTRTFEQTRGNKKEMDNLEVDNAEMNKDTLSLKSRQPFTLKEMVKRQNVSESFSGNYSPSDPETLDKNSNYSNMPDCLTESALHLDEAVKSMVSAERMEKSLVDALRVVNRRILDIQKNISETKASDAVNPHKGDKSGSGTVEMSKSDSKQNLQNDNDKCLDSESRFAVNCNVHDIQLPGSTTCDKYDQPQTSGLNKNYNNAEKFYNAKNNEERKCLPDGDKKLNYSLEDEAIIPSYEIPDNEILESNKKERMRVMGNPNGINDMPSIHACRPPPPFLGVPPPLRKCFPFGPPPPPLPRMNYFSDNQTRPSILPIPYPWPVGPSINDLSKMYKPGSDYKSGQVGLHFENVAKGHPRPRLSHTMSDVSGDGKSKDAGIEKTQNKFRQEQKICLQSAMKLIESYNTSDDDEEDNDSPDIRPFDIKKLEVSSKLDKQQKKTVEKPTHKKLKKDMSNDWSLENDDECVGKMDAHVKQWRSRKLKQKSLKSFISTERSPPICSTVSDSVYKTDMTKSVLKKKTLAEIISEGQENTEFPPSGIEADEKLPNFPPLPPFPNSPFWSMYAPESTSVLRGNSPIETSPKVSSFGGYQRRQSHNNLLKRYSVSPGSGLYSPSETDSEKTSYRNDWKKNFKAFHDFGVKYIDTHCHLDFLFNREKFKGTFQAYMDKHSETFPDLFEGCVAVFCNPSSFNPNSGLWLEVAKESNVWIAMGCHPKNATDFTAAAEYGLTKCMQHEKCIALGEIGLDYSGTFWRHEEVQKRVFRCQLKMAVALGKPLVIHSRDAEDDCIEILKEIVPRNWKIHCHCFTNSYSNAKLWINEFPNLYIGVTPLVTYRSATPTHDLARKLPLNKLLLETDAPYFVPRSIPRDDLPLSNPGLAITVAKEVAKYQEVPVSEVLRQCRLNTKAMYGI